MCQVVLTCFCKNSLIDFEGGASICLNVKVYLYLYVYVRSWRAWQGNLWGKSILFCFFCLHVFCLFKVFLPL